MLTPEDAAAVLRRASELDTPALEQHGALDEQVVRDAAREVGLSPRAVDQAVAEWRAGALQPLPPLQTGRRLGLLASVVVEAQIAIPPDDAHRQVQTWLDTQWFEQRRHRGSETEWRPRPGLLATARRAVDFNRTMRLSRVDRLTTCLAPAAGGTRVRLVAELTDLRAGLSAGLVIAPGVLTGVLTGVVVATGNPMPEVLLSLPVALGVGGAGWLASSAVLATNRARVAEELERAVSQLELLQPRLPLSQRASSWAAQRLPGRT